jgi:hypothetical protein
MCLSGSSRFSNGVILIHERNFDRVARHLPGLLRQFGDLYSVLVTGTRDHYRQNLAQRVDSHVCVRALATLVPIPYDLEVLGFKGDIRASVYFLQAVRTWVLLHVFYITRIQGQRRARTMVMFVQRDMWAAIDGEAMLVMLEQVADTLPQAARIVHRGVELTAID